VDEDRQPELALVVRRTIAAPVERVFAAWTEPEQLRRWWGPKGVACSSAEVELRVGGRYRLGNRMPDGSTLYIVGEFERIERPRELVYSWRHEGDESAPMRVTVRFETIDRATEVIVVHERLRDIASRDRHAAGWDGCLDGLAAHLS
jgi:uncharacterized protein YndB with AHSA1/START domain